MSSSDRPNTDQRSRSAVLRLASELVGTDAVREATSLALGARERAVELQELTLNALNLPSAAVIDRLTRRVRSVSLRLEGIEDALDRLESRLEQIADLQNTVAAPAAPAPAAAPAAKSTTRKAAAPTPATRKAAAPKPAVRKAAAPKPPVRKVGAPKPAAAKAAAPKPAVSKVAAPKPAVRTVAPKVTPT